MIELLKLWALLFGGLLAVFAIAFGILLALEYHPVVGVAAVSLVVSGALAFILS